MVSTNLADRPRIRVLLVDESALFLRAATYFLHQYPEIEVVGALDRGDQVIAQAQALQPQVLLLDPTLVGRQGLDVIGELRAALPGIGIIILSLLDVGAFRSAALSAGALAFVSKASAGTELLSAIRRAAQVDTDEDRETIAPQPQSPWKEKGSMRPQVPTHGS